MTQLREPREVIREEPLMHAPILDALADGPATIPDIAARIGAPVHEVVYWVMGMRRFGLLAESTEADDDGYFAYGPVGAGPAQEPVDISSVDETCLTARDNKDPDEEGAQS